MYWEQSEYLRRTNKQLEHMNILMNGGVPRMGLGLSLQEKFAVYLPIFQTEKEHETNKTGLLYRNVSHNR